MMQIEKSVVFVGKFEPSLKLGMEAWKVRRLVLFNSKISVQQFQLLNYLIFEGF
jgi:hypothetical protein